MFAAFALASSLLWGTSDFLGGRATRRWSALQVLCWSQSMAFIGMWLVVWLGGFEVDGRSLAIAAAGGVAGVIALAAFYRALSIGPMAVVPPLAATGVALPVVVGLARGGAPSALAIGGLVVAVVGVVLAAGGESGDGESGGGRIAPSTLLLCAIAATGFAIIFVALDAAADSGVRSAVVATAGVRLGSVTALLVATLATRLHPWRGVSARNVGGFLVIGCFDTGANLVFAISASLGSLEVAAVLGSLYPAVTSALACIVLGERLGRRQIVGVVLALAGVAMLAAA